MVRQDSERRWLHFGDNDVQAVINLNQPSQLTLPYSIGMLSALIIQPDPKTCLNLGLGGASFERFFARQLPELRVTSLESDPAVIRLARSYFMLPPQQPVILSDASAFLASHQSRYDLILCDIHQGNGHPECLTDTHFHADAFDCLNVAGVYAINLLPQGFSQLINVLMRLRDSFPYVQVLDIPERRNLILLALKQSPPEPDILLQRVPALAERLNIAPELLRIPPTALPQRDPG